jgi:hypothetical protein
LSGTLAIGTTATGNYNLRIGRNITGATTANNITLSSTVASDVTVAAYGIDNIASTAAASFTLSTYYLYSARQGSIGAGSAITNQMGFRVESTLTGATNNYGFYGDIASGTGRWNLYMNGTAANYLAGNLSIATLNTPRRLNINQALGGNCAMVGLYASGGSFVAAIGAQITTSNLQFASTVGILFYTGSTIGGIADEPTNERMRLTNLGNLLIGSTTDSGEKLQVTGTAKITGQTTITSHVLQNGTGLFRIENSGSSAPTGSAGIGIELFTSGSISYIESYNRTSSAYEQLNIRGSILNFRGTATFISSVTSTAFIPSSATVPTNGLYLAAANTLTFSTNSAEKMRIDASGSIGIGSASINASAILQADSTTKGFLAPRMTNAQRTAISSPAVGLIVYCTDLVEGLYVYKSTGWTFVI